MSVVHAAGFHVRDALARALATTNQSPGEATFRVLSARAHLDARGRVASAEVTVRVERPRDAGGDPPPGLINPDGLHPLMAGVPGRPGRLMDVFPVTVDRWARHGPGGAPQAVDPWCPQIGVTLAAAATWASAAGKSLPDAEDLRAAWGRARYPWGDRPDDTRGHAAPHRFGVLAEVGWYPPSDAGFFDLGAWLHQWTADGDLLGGAPGLASAPPGSEPCGFRCVQEV
jgi:hypothetical protein